MTKGKFLSEKTNVMRILDKNKIPYKSRFYENTGAVSGMEVAEVLGQDPSEVFKTSVTVGTSGNYYVFIVPVSRELNLKKAASFVGEKSVSMIKSKELLPLTGYIHGGCSPVGMKKLFRTVMDSSAKEKNTVMVSGGKIGCQIEISPADLAKVVPFDFSDIT